MSLKSTGLSDRWTPRNEENRRAFLGAQVDTCWAGQTMTVLRGCKRSISGGELRQQVTSVAWDRLRLGHKIPWESSRSPLLRHSDLPQPVGQLCGIVG